MGFCLTVLRCLDVVQLLDYARTLYKTSIDRDQTAIINVFIIIARRIVNHFVATGCNWKRKSLFHACIIFFYIHPLKFLNICTNLKFFLFGQISFHSFPIIFYFHLFKYSNISNASLVVSYVRTVFKNQYHRSMKGSSRVW